MSIKNLKYRLINALSNVLCGVSDALDNALAKAKRAEYRVAVWLANHY